MWFPRQENWNGFSCPPPVDFPDTGMEPTSVTSTVMTGRFFTTHTTWAAQMKRHCGPSPSWKQHVTPGRDLRGTDWPARAEAGWHKYNCNKRCKSYKHLEECSVCCWVAHSCLTVCDLMDCSPLGSSVRGILQARTLEQVAISSFRGSFQPRDGTLDSCVFCTGRQILYHWPPGKPS